ncbi:MAG: DOMON-like domain-containing protein [Caulobacterales bacterium]
MRVALIRHPDTPCAAVAGIEAQVARSAGGALTLSYAVTGAIRDLVLPPPGAPARVDELWRSTCFEAFVGAASGEGYFEFNLAPSMQWAAYAFSGYRAGMRIASEIAQPRIDVRATPDRFDLTAALDLEAVADLPAGAVWRIALSAVIEEAGGAKSYWALAHPPGRPDFHHARAFALGLSPPERS